MGVSFSESTSGRRPSSLMMRTRSGQAGAAGGIGVTTGAATWTGRGGSRRGRRSTHGETNDDRQSEDAQGDEDG